MAAVVANGGFLYRPTIIHHITDSEGNIVRPFEPEVLNSTNVDRQWLDIVAEGMKRVNEEGGTAYAFTPFGEWSTAGSLPTIANPFLFAGKRYDASLGS